MSATIYFAGSEDVDFIPDGYLLGWQAIGLNRPAWSRGALTLQTIANNASFPYPEIRNGTDSFEVTPTFTNVSTFWFHAQQYSQSLDLTALTTFGANFLGFASPDGIWRLALRGAGGDGQIQLIKRDSTGTITVLATSSTNVFFSGLNQIDVNVVYGTTGSVNVYYEGVNSPALSYSGDITTEGETELNRCFLGLSRDSYVTAWSEVIITDTDSRSMGLFTMPPLAPGNTQDWIGDDNDINKQTIDDSTYINSQTADQLSEWTTPTSLPPGQWEIETIWQTVRINRGLVGPQHFEFLSRPATAGADYTSTDVFPAAAYDNYTYNWSVNPATSAQWSLADIATGFNLGIKSTT